MTENDYNPVSCDYHDQLEAAAMHHNEVRLEFDQNGVRLNQRGTIADVFTEDGAEFISFESGSGSIRIRLDEIISFTDI